MGEGTPRIALIIYEPTRKIKWDITRVHHKVVSWRIHLISPSTLPTVDCVQALLIRTPCGSFHLDWSEQALRNLDLRIILDLAKKCPKLEILRCNVGGYEWRIDYKFESVKFIAQPWDGPRRDSQHDFGKAAEGLQDALPMLRHIGLDFLYPSSHVDNIDQRAALPNLVLPSTYDPLSSSLRQISYQLRTMILHVVADDTLFWPRSGAAPFWPRLETISVRFHMSTPSGSWYFQGLPGVGATQGYDLDPDRLYPPLVGTAQDARDADKFFYDDYMHWEDMTSVQFRSDPNEDTLVPFLTAFAKATKSMPSLKEFALWSPLNVQSLDYSPGDVSSAYENFDVTQVSRLVSRWPHMDLAWGIAYVKPGVRAFWRHPGTDYSQYRQIWWRVAKWRPNTELHTLFSEIGMGAYGDEVWEYWEDEFGGQGLCCADDIDYWEYEISSGLRYDGNRYHI